MEVIFLSTRLEQSLPPEELQCNATIGKDAKEVSAKKWSLLVGRNYLQLQPRNEERDPSFLPFHSLGSHES